LTRREERREEEERGDEQVCLRRRRDDEDELLFSLFFFSDPREREIIRIPAFESTDLEGIDNQFLGANAYS
jgi:hypothetical protein